MKRITLLLSLLAISLTICAQNTPKSYSWRGLINNKWPVQVYLEVYDGIIQGEMIYTKTTNKIPIVLLGEVGEPDENGVKDFFFNEMSETGEMTGHMYGKVTANGGFSGSWLAPNKITWDDNVGYTVKEGKEYTLNLSQATIKPTKPLSWEIDIANCQGKYSFSYCKNGRFGELLLTSKGDKLICKATGITSAPQANQAIVDETACEVHSKYLTCNIDDDDNYMFKIIPFKNFAVVRYTEDSNLAFGYFGMGATIEGVYLKMPEKNKTIKVSNAQQFIDAIGSDRTIILSQGIDFNLSDVIDQYFSDGETPPAISGPFPKHNHVYLSNEFDGNQLNIHDVDNLKIIGEGSIPVKLMVRPRYSYVFSFIASNNITIENVDAGHTNGGYCVGGVFMFDNCSDVTINNTIMYGCGTEGITAMGTSNLTCTNSTIKECTYSIMTLEDCDKITYSSCQFFDNMEFGLVNVRNSSSILFEDCSFFRNKGTLFSLSSPITLKNCSINHPMDHLGSTDMIKN